MIAQVPAQLDLVNSSPVFQNLSMGEQTEQTGKPRKRRRWLIAAVLLMAVSSVTWWNWPRGDARFVGKWSTRTVHPIHYELRANGTGIEVIDGHYRTTTWRLTWHATEEELVLRYYVPLTDLYYDPSRFAEALVGREFRYTIHSCSPSEFVLSRMIKVQGVEIPIYETYDRDE